MPLDLQAARIMVTGGGGFLGRVVVGQLRDRGIEALVPRRADYDLTTEAGVSAAFADFEPDVVMHLAAEVGGIGANQRNPGRFFYANLAMGMHLIEHARRRGVKRFVQVGTVCAYPKHTPVPFREESLWDGYPEDTNAPYGIAKKALLVMLQSYREQYGFPGSYLLPVNLYGPGDSFDLNDGHVIPALIRKFAAARDAGAPTVEVWGSGSASREFLYVDDCARGLIAALARYDSPEPVNLGSGQEVSIRELAAKIRALTGYAGEIVWDDARPDGQPRRRLDTSRARDAFGFEAEVDLDEGLARTIAWWEAQARVGACAGE